MNKLDEKPAFTDILGTRISAVNTEQTLDLIDHWIKNDASKYICITNTQSIMLGFDDSYFRRVQNEAALATPDGMPMVWLSKLAGKKHVERVYGPDLLLAVCRHSETQAYRHYFFGGTDEVATRLVDRLQSQFPDLNVVGTYSPPFRSLTPDEDAEVVRRINAANPDIVWVGLGCPKQEIWMHQHVDRLNAPVLVGVGAAFDFHSGTKLQAPKFMRHMGLEMIFRACTEPKRLGPRLLQNHPRFLALLLMKSLGFHIQPKMDSQMIEVTEVKSQA